MISIICKIICIILIAVALVFEAEDFREDYQDGCMKYLLGDSVAIFLLVLSVVILIMWV